jgi:hypothetical protein
MSESPIGRLIVATSETAKTMKNKTHTKTAPCGCRVTVSWFSEGGSSNKIEPCSAHPVRKERT